MLAFVFGTSTPFAYWGFAAVQLVVETLHGDVQHVHCLTLDGLRDAWTKLEGRNVVVTSDVPEGALSGTLLQLDAPCLVFLDEPEDAIAYATNSRGLDIKSGLKFLALNFSALHESITEGSAVCIRRRDCGDDVVGVYKRILLALQGSADPSVLDRIMRAANKASGLGERDGLASHLLKATGPPFDSRSWIDSQTDEDRRLIGSICETYRPLLAQRDVEAVNWPLSLYYLDGSYDNVSGYIDLTGPARYLAWGPYLYLPKGRWIARVEFEVAENISGNAVEFDIVIAEQIAIARAELPATGSFAAELDFVVTRPTVPVEVRCQLRSGAIEGRFRLNSVKITRAGASPRDPAFRAPGRTNSTLPASA